MKKIPRKGWVSLGCFITSLVLIPLAVSTSYTIIMVASSVLSGFGWGIIYALPSNSDKQSRSE